MKALISETNEVRSNLQDKSILVLLKQKIEESILNKHAVCVSIENPSMNCLNKVYIDDYEIDDERIYLNEFNYEITILLDDQTEITYDNENYEYAEYFIIKNKDTVIELFF